MSQPRCDACTELREYAPAFVMNGVTDNVAASLKNNTGVAWRNDNCEDLQDIIDCLIGRKVQELESLDVCDWKDFMQKFGPNLYETLKAMIMNECGQWSSLCNLYSIVSGAGAKPHNFTWAEGAKAKWQGHGNGKPDYDDSKWRWALQAEIRPGTGCGGTGLAVWGLGWYPNQDMWPYIFSFSAISAIEEGEILAYINKSEVVPHDMPESLWDDLMRGWFSQKMFYLHGSGFSTLVRYRVRGYIVIDGVEFNEDLKDTYGANVMVLQVSEICGTSNSGGANGDEIMLSQRVI